MQFQRTVKSKVACRSVGLHSGRKINLIIKPAEINDGIVFVRKDLLRNNMIKAELKNVCDTTLATTLGVNGTRVSTVEHLLSAFRGMGVDNAVVEIDSPEIPIMDGSALPLVNLLKSVGTIVQGNCKNLLVIKETISLTDGDGWVMLVPSPEFKITYKINFEHPKIGEQSYHIVFSDVAYEKDICAARTFGFIKDVEYLQAKGLALGGSLDNVVVLDDEKIINKEGLRFSDEFVRHKILDVIGDLSLLGIPIIGHFVAYKSGHRLNNLLLEKLLANEENWKIVSCFDEEEEIDEIINTSTFSVLDAIPA